MAKTFTTSYRNAFIEVAEDCPATKGEIPPVKGDRKSAASIQYEMIGGNPYQYTSDDVLFQCFACKNEIPATEKPAAREIFFSKGQPCMRASSLAKRYGWGIHSDAAERIALVGCETAEYAQFVQNTELKHLKAMRSGK